ncbi:hypothetical protein FRC18_002825 [Serendipita sp. 400]|nr:hypothetical protein FRC18_002825 [Serendipita sp. 400]
MPTTTVLADNSLKSVAAYLDSDACKNSVFVMCGAGTYLLLYSSLSHDRFANDNALFLNLFRLNHFQASLQARAFPTLDLQKLASMCVSLVPAYS